MVAFVDYISSFGILPEEEIQYFRSQLSVLQLKKGRFLLKPGDDASRLAYVRSGLVKISIQMQNGKEVVKSFYATGSVVTDFTSYINGTPASVSIKALSDTSLIVTQPDIKQNLELRNLIWSKVELHMAQQIYMRKSKRETEFLTLNAREIYDKFLKENPEIISKIPQKDLASYIGVTPVSLSRLLRTK